MHKTKPALENKTHKIRWLWDSNGSPNPEQKTRINFNLQEQRNTSSNGFYYFSEPKSKIGRKRKGWQILGSCQGVKIAVEHVSDGDTNNSWGSWNSP